MSAARAPGIRVCCAPRMERSSRPLGSRSSPRVVRSLLLLAVLVLSLVPGRASAYERQWHAGLDVGTLGAWSGLGLGVASGVRLSYGVKDWLDLQGAVDVSYHPGSTALITTGAAGVRFAFDVLQVVPHIGLLAGVGDVAVVGSACAAGCNQVRFDIAVPFGVDYQVSRAFTIGVGGKFQLLLANGPATPMLGAFARAEYVWGY